MTRRANGFEQFAVQNPKWAISFLIFALSTGAFVIWWITWEPSRPSVSEGGVPEISLTPPSDPTPTSTEEFKHSDQLVDGTIEIRPETMFFMGRDLYEVTENEAVLVKEDWFERAPILRDQITYFPEDKILAISHSDGAISLFNSSGSFISKLDVRARGEFDGYAAFDYKTVVYVREGDIWRGEIDLLNAKILNQTQVTNTGTFLGNPFRGRLLAGTEKALLYKDPTLGLLHVNLETGATDTGQLPSNSVTGPNGQLLIGDLPGRPAQLIVFDVDTAETLSLEIPVRLPQNGFTWLDGNRAAIILSNQVQIYDHAEKELSIAYQSSAPEFSLRFVTLPSADGNFIMIEDQAAGILSVNTKTLEASKVIGPPANYIEFLHGGAFLLSSDVGNTQERGTWLGKFGEERLERIFSVPFRLKIERNRQLRRSSVILPGGAAFLEISGNWKLIYNNLDVISTNLRTAELFTIQLAQ